jgi:hypothetical protein
MHSNSHHRLPAKFTWQHIYLHITDTGLKIGVNQLGGASADY